MDTEVTRIKYTGSTPGADANTYSLFNTVTAGCPRDWASMNAIEKFNWDIDHDQSGTVRGYYSLDRGVTWVEFYNTGALAAPTLTDQDRVSVKGYADFKFDWVNGGAAQGTWVVNLSVSKPN